MVAMRLDEQAIFEVARKIAAHEAREAFLQQVCGDDAALGHRVRALLQAHEESASFLEAPAAGLPSPPGGEGSGVRGTGATVDEPVAERPGTVLGPYKLLEQIGEGGMGLVFVAEQQHPVRRKVALKVIKPGMDTRAVIARFEAERQALALMDHPNIARVLDAGTTGNPKSDSRNPKQIQSTKSQIQNQAESEVLDIGASDLDIVSDFGFRASDLDRGRPYFVMELVRGLSVTDYCDQHNVPIRDRLALFLDVC